MIVNLKIILWSNIMSVSSSDMKTNGFKLMRLIVDVGGEALRITLRKQLSGTDLFNVLNDPENTQLLSSLKNRQIQQHQWDLLYPDLPILPNENDFDITLLCILLRNTCDLKPPRDPIWTSVNNPNDHSTEADITRIRLFRNERFAHLTSTSVSFDEFENHWLEISEPLVRLGISQKEIDRLKNELFGNEECERILREWNRLKSDLTDIKTDQRGIKKVVEGVEKNLQQVKDFVTVIKDEVYEMRHHPHLGPEEDILTKNLVSCKFESEIRLV
ncbi:E3 ubiquitin-protein ligase DZIP3-like [Xenia sp. Carnegie-2017]|uniref:E3 ubiquitin-protein ligase DZIP3-like n=1 Tax=Xenia sp. Carnegie-2017 TaxID=2897299 RepID=UPI001F03A339|nr:E3 ubiquitin-protein ligase DZIP3-like [Xenia sp. Carnegie-2017]